ncbi:MAG: hydroxymethylbilane synthase [Acidobacteria bacterium]|nr:hydroxymethylbilane synthase [Acidobacteriota bacterium]
MKNKLVLGSRGSQLALWQTRFVAQLLQSVFPLLDLEIKTIETTGDALLETALSKIGDKGLFTKQIEEELLNGEIDLAVHSLKDLPTTLPDGLKIGAVTMREIPNDVLISTKFSSIDDLPRGASVATGSLRRKSQLLAYRADLRIVEIRGNVPTRIRKMEEANLDAMILAFAGVHRLGMDSFIKQQIPFEIMLPAVAQGVIGIEIREKDAETEEFLRLINDEMTEICVLAERSFLRTLEGGCQVPIGGHAILNDDEITLQGFVGNMDGSATMRDSITGNRNDAVELGIKLAERMIENGANNLLTETRREAEKSHKKVV